MSLTRIVLVAAFLAPIAGLWPQGAAVAPQPIQMNQAGTSSDQAADQKVLTLNQCLEAALSKSDSAAILQKNLAISQAQYRQTVAKNAVSLNAGLSGGATGGFGNATILSGSSATTIGTSVDYTTAIPFNYTGSISLNGPQTSLSIAGGGSFSNVAGTNVNASSFRPRPKPDSLGRLSGRDREGQCPARTPQSPIRGARIRRERIDPRLPDQASLLLDAERPTQRRRVPAEP